MNTKQERNTQTKQAVAHVLQSFAAPIALGELHQFIKMSLPKTAFSTVYRILQKLEEEGKVIRIDWRERGSRYEWADLPHHHHIVCDDCGNVTDIDDSVIDFNESRVSKQTGFRIKHHSIELQGTCEPCQKKGNHVRAHSL